MHTVPSRERERENELVGRVKICDKNWLIDESARDPLAPFKCKHLVINETNQNGESETKMVKVEFVHIDRKFNGDE